MSQELKAPKIASVVALSLAIMKWTIWIMTWSIAVLSSAIDSILDFFVSVFNSIALKRSKDNPDDEFNFWKWKLEHLAAFVEWLIISLSWAYIFYESVKKLIVREEIQEINIALYVMAISAIVTLFLVIYLNKVYKKTWNTLIQADSLHYKTDLFTNIWIFISLIIIKLTWLYFIDWIIWVIISVYIIYEAYKIIKLWFVNILDKALNDEIVNKIEEVINNDKNIEWFHFLKTRRSAKTYFVQAHLVFKDSEILLKQAHDISDNIEKEIYKIDCTKRWKIDFHLDPYNDKEEELNMQRFICEE